MQLIFTGFNVYKSERYPKAYLILLVIFFIKSANVGQERIMYLYSTIANSLLVHEIMYIQGILKKVDKLAGNRIQIIISDSFFWYCWYIFDRQSLISISKPNINYELNMTSKSNLA